VPPSGIDAVRFETPLWEPLDPASWMGLSPVQRRLVGALHTDALLRDRGRATRDALRDGPSWCHGDARTANFCVLPSGVPQLVDWETSGLGRPETDLGLLCGAVITDSLLSVDGPPGPAARAALGQAVARATGYVRLVLGGYRAAPGGALDSDLLASAVGCALLTRAVVRASVTSWDRIVMALYEIGRGLVLRPARWKAIDPDG
ncbi:MAG TPA: phosphotransferase, partial [Pseudonocardia sp.]|nr:phosphotransferase [Pseudonocardia sp.]